MGGAVHHTGSLYMAEAAQLDRVARVRRAIDLPVIHAGGIVTPEVAEAALAEGCLDVVGITKGHFADAHFVNKLREGGARRSGSASAASSVVTAARVRSAVSIIR